MERKKMEGSDKEMAEGGLSVVTDKASQVCLARNEFVKAQLDLANALAREAKCIRCGGEEALTVLPRPIFNSSAQLQMSCITEGCGYTDSLESIGHSWMMIEYMDEETPLPHQEDLAEGIEDVDNLRRQYVRLQYQPEASIGGPPPTGEGSASSSTSRSSIESGASRSTSSSSIESGASRSTSSSSIESGASRSTSSSSIESGASRSTSSSSIESGANRDVLENELAVLDLDLQKAEEEFRVAQLNIVGGVCKLARCISCGKAGTLGAPSVPRFNESSKLLVSCIDVTCGRDGTLPAVADHWLQQSGATPAEDPHGEMSQAVLKVGMLRATVLNKTEKVHEVRAILATFPVDSRSVMPPPKPVDKGSTPSNKSRNPFKPLTPKTPLTTTRQPLTPLTTTQRSRSRSRDRDRERGRENNSPDGPTLAGKLKKGLELQRGTRVEMTERRSVAGEQDKQLQSEHTTTVKRGVPDELMTDEPPLKKNCSSPTREEYQALLGENCVLRGQVQQLIERVQRMERELNSRGEEGAMAVETPTPEACVRGRGGRLRKGQRRKSTSGRVDVEAGMVAMEAHGPDTKVPAERVSEARGLSYAEAAAKPVDPARSKAKVQRERARALKMFTDAAKPKEPPQEWRVLHLKWTLTEKVRKSTDGKGRHHLALRMLEQLKIRRYVREVSLVGKHVVSLYYIHKFQDRIMEAVDGNKLSIVEDLEPLPDSPVVRTAAVNRVAFLLTRYKYIPKLRAVILEQLAGDKQLEEEAIEKSAVHHDA
jgi:hypothetical protein